MPPYPKLQLTEIKYNSPSGIAIVGKYVPPFEEVLNGFGYLGVVITDKGTGKIQCHICGEWHENLPTHLRRHNITASNYKLKFGLLQSTALKSRKLRLAQSKLMIKMRQSHPKHRIKFKKNNQWAGNRKNKPKALESRNKYGVCDVQISQRIIDLTKRLGKTPTLIDIYNEFGGGFIAVLHSRYGSYVQFCKNLGLTPNFSNYNPKYDKKYFIEKALSNEPSMRIFTVNERAGLYRLFKGGINELREEIQLLKTE
jgi:hypothetical protein